MSDATMTAVVPQAPNLSALAKSAPWWPTATTEVLLTASAAAEAAWTKYAAAVDDYALSETSKQLAVGHWAHEYLLTYVGNEADTGKRRARRAAAMRRCQDYINGQCSTDYPTDVDSTIRLYAVAQVYGSTDACRLVIGKLRKFEVSLYRDKETEAWGWKDNVTEEQQTALRELWAGVVSGTVSCTPDELAALVGKAMGKTKPVKAKPAAVGKPRDVSPGSGKPAVVSYAGTKMAERVPEVAPEDTVECARRMASLPYGRPDSAMVWRNMGVEVLLSEEDAAAFVAGLCGSGKLQALVALAKAAVAAVGKLQADAKTVQAA